MLIGSNHSVPQTRYSMNPRSYHRAALKVLCLLPTIFLEGHGVAIAMCGQMSVSTFHRPALISHRPRSCSTFEEQIRRVSGQTNDCPLNLPALHDAKLTVTSRPWPSAQSSRDSEDSCCSHGSYVTLVRSALTLVILKAVVPSRSGGSKPTSLDRITTTSPATRH